MLSGKLVGAELVQSVYDKDTRSAEVTLRIKKSEVAKMLENSVNK